MSAMTEDLASLLELNISDLRFLAFDTETTGFSAGKDHVVELAASLFDEEFEHRCFQTLVKPPIPIPAQVVAIHGIDDATVAAAPPAAAALSLFQEYVDGAPHPRVLLAHNCAFDIGFLHEEARIAKWKGAAAPELVLDTCTLAKALLPDQERHSLSVVATTLKVPMPDKLHRAAADVEVLRGVFLKLLGIAADRAVSRGGVLTLGALVDLCCGYHVLHPGAPGARATGSFRLSPQLEKLNRLCGTDTAVQIVYGDADAMARTITPLAVRTKSFRVYVDAYCHGDNVRKTFRGDRILKVAAP